MIDRLYRLKHDAPFVPFGILTKSGRRYSINRPQDLGLPPDRKGGMFVIWQGGKCVVVKFSQVDSLRTIEPPESDSFLQEASR